MLPKATFLFAAILLFTASAATAQKVESTPFYGFQFGGDFEDRFVCFA